MRKRLIKTLYFENGELYTVTQGRRVLLAGCAPKIEIYEHLSDVPVLGRSCAIKEWKVSIVICDGMDFTRRVDVDFLKTVTQFDLSADIQRTDGVYENIVFDNLIPSEIDLSNSWVFGTENQAILKKLLAL